MSEERLAPAVRDRLHAARGARTAGAFDVAAAAQGGAIDALRESADAAALAHALRHLGDILTEAGRLVEAAAPSAEAERLYLAAPAADALDVANTLRSIARHAQLCGDAADARRRWIEVRERYAALEAVFHTTYALDHNPGVRECDLRLAELG